MQLTKNEQFFFDHAGYSFNPATETKEQGRMRCAKELAAAEAHAIENGWHLEVNEDGQMYGWHGTTFDIISCPDDFTGQQYRGFDADLYDSDGNMLASLGGVTFADDNEHEPYRRVIFAELAEQAKEEQL